jgi:cell division protein FtsN
MEDFNINSGLNNLAPASNSKSKKALIFLAVVILVAVVGYLAWKYLEKTHILKQPYTEEEKMDVLKNLRTPPPDDGSVIMTTEEKMEILNTISTKKSDPSIKKRPLTEEEQQQISDSFKQ